jgi:hypothetical protein
MPSPATVLATIATDIATLTSGTRLGSDLSTAVERIAAGALRFQLKTIWGGIYAQSNVNLARLNLDVSIHRRLGASEAERTYTEGALLTHQASLFDLTWWAARAGVFDVWSPPSSSQSDLSRDGDGEVISYRLTVGVICAA